MKDNDQLLDGEKWEHYMTRPFNILSCSIVAYWYSRGFKNLIGRNSSSLNVEETKGLTRCYRLQKDNKLYRSTILNLCRDDPEQILSFLAKGDDLNKKAEIVLKKKNLSANEVLDFAFDLGFYATDFPNNLLESIAGKELEFQKICERATLLRSISYYPQIFTKRVYPSARFFLEEKFKGKSKEWYEIAVEVISVNDILFDDCEDVEARVKEKEGNLFVYEYRNNKDIISFSGSTGGLIEQLEPNHKKTASEKGQKVLKGSSVFKGKVQGVARVVNTLDYEDIVFNKGDILISINSNPSMMKLIKKAGAIVTEEGGAGTHASIIAREFKISCIVGVRDLFLSINDGDLIEVDADNGVVKKL